MLGYGKYPDTKRDYCCMSPLRRINVTLKRPEIMVSSTCLCDVERGAVAKLKKSRQK